MHITNRQKKSRILFTTVLLLNMFTQAAVPFVAQAETGDVPGQEEIVEVDKTELDSLVAEADRYDAANYTEETFAAYEEALVEAESVLGTEAATQANVDHAIADLQTAINRLAEVEEPEEVEVEDTDLETSALEEEADEEPEEVEEEEEIEETTVVFAAVDAPADKTELEALIAQAEAAIADIQAALDEAQAVLDNPEATQDEVDAAHSTLETELEEANTAEPFNLSVMHMNDTHARVAALPNMMTAINSFRADNPSSLLLHAGDVFSGTLYFNEFRGQADLALLNLMGIDAMVFGNHEFDLGNSDAGHQALAAFVDGANFPFLGTNVDFSGDSLMAPYETGSSVVADPAAGQIYNSIVKSVDGEEIGIFGLTTEDTVNIASPVNVAFNDYLNAAEEAVTAFEAAGIDKIIAVTHIGYASAPVVGNDLLLAELVDGIDVIVGGHSHTALAEPTFVDAGESPTVIVQAGANAENLGTLDVTFDSNGVVIEYAGELLSVSDYEANAEAAEILAPFQADVDAINNEEIGATAVNALENPRLGDGDPVSVRANETPLGNLVTDAMLARTKQLYPETVIAFQNGGGVRAPIDAGPITVGEVIEVLPFGNNPVVVDLTGQEIKDLLEIAVSSAPEESGGFLHVSGMQFYYDSHAEPYNRVQAMYVEQNGELVEIQLDEWYLVTTNAYTGGGGDNLTPFAVAYEEGRVQDTGAIDWEQLRDYMVEDLGGVVDPVLEGRIIDLLGEPLPEEEPETPEEETPGDDGSGNGGSDDNGSGNNTSGTGQSDEDSSDSDDSTEQADGKPLPKTGSNIIVPLVSGATLILSGLGVETLRRKKYNK